MIYCNSRNKNAIVNIQRVQDNVDYWIEYSEKKYLSEEEKLIALEKAFTSNKSKRNDSLKLIRFTRIAYSLLKYNDSIDFKNCNQEALKLSIALNDSTYLANAYWYYADYYLKHQIFDSAYYYYSKTAKLYKSLDENYLLGRVLYNMSVVLKDINDYTGSEICAFEAIKNFDVTKHQYNLYLNYNILGVIYSNLQEFDKSLESHKKALKYLEEIKEKRTLVEGSLNNIGLVYQNQGNYKLAINSFNEALENDSLRYKDIGLYTRLLDNLAYNRLLSGDTLGVYKALLKPLRLRDSMNNISGEAISNLHLSEFFAFKQDTTKAIVLAKNAVTLAKSVDNHRDHLAALQLLANLDHNNSSVYLSTYVKLNDSLQKEERAIRNKFTRIQFETDEYIDETKRLTSEKMLISITGIAVLLLTVSLFFIRLQRAKNKRLVLEQEQQNDREEIYRLMLAQQSKLEEGRLQERTRISEELHDGILGSMYGMRIGLGFLKIQGDKEIKDRYKEYLTEIHQIEKEIRAVSHALKSEALSSRNDFVSMIKMYLERLNQTEELVITFKNDPNIIWEEVNEEIKINVFRIIQELYFNAIKHAHAKNLLITFAYVNSQINVVVEDDGIGFEVNKAKKGIGLKNIKSRVQKLEGTLQIDSNKNLGTKFSIFIKNN